MSRIGIIHQVRTQVPFVRGYMPEALDWNMPVLNPLVMFRGFPPSNSRIGLTGKVDKASGVWCPARRVQRVG